MDTKRIKKTFENLKVNLYFGLLSGLPFVLFLLFYIAPKVEQDKMKAKQEAVKSSIDSVYDHKPKI